jgi:RNA polymerase sigma factor (sigma-70 family)
MSVDAAVLERVPTPRAEMGGRSVAVDDLERAGDRDLVQRVGAGDREAFRALFRRYGPVAKALAVRIARQPFLAEEIVQEAFLSFWRDPGRYRQDRGSFRAWLMSAVHHRAVDSVRREEAQRRRAQEAEADAQAEAPDVGERVVEDAALAQSRARVRSALREIPAEQREVLERMYYEGKTQAVISQELGLPLGTVKSRTLLGMRRLRGLLLQEEELA